MVDVVRSSQGRVARAQRLVGTIFRRRHGHGRAAFGILIEFTVGPNGCRGAVGAMPARDRFGMECYGPAVGRVDLMRLHEAEWAPPFVSRIRQQARAQKAR